MKKYWFLYDLTSGEIKASQKVETDDWTNIPEGCGVLGFGDDTTAVVLDAYENRNLYEVQNGEIVQKIDADARRIDAAKSFKIAKLNAACNQSILAGFTSSALGAEHQYGFDMEDQANLTGRLAGIAAGTSPAEFLWKTKDVGPLLHTIAQFKQVCADGDARKESQISRYWTLKSQVEAAEQQFKNGEIDAQTAMAQMDAVAW